MITVYHNSNFAKDSYDEEVTGTITKVATIESNSLEEAFELTQNLAQPWTKNERVKAEAEIFRSTSAGDVMELDNLFYFVADFGFKQISNPLITK